MLDILSYRRVSRFLSAIPIDQLKTGMDKQTFKLMRYGGGQVMHFDGDCCKAMELILSGQVVVERLDASGNLLKITDLSVDDVIGGNLIFSKNHYYPMMVTAKTETVILAIPQDSLFDLCQKNKDFLRLFLELISDQAIMLGHTIKHAIKQPIRSSLLAFLKTEAMRQNSHVIHLGMTKKDLADRMGIQRTSLSRELQKMKKEGLVDYNRTSITLIK